MIVIAYSLTKELLAGPKGEAPQQAALPGLKGAADLNAMPAALGRVPCLGSNTFGRIAMADGQFGGFHNRTAVACAIPE